MFKKLIRPLYIIAAISVFVVVLLPALFEHKVSASGQLTNRSLQLLGVGTTGGSLPGGTVDDIFSFDTATTANIGSVQFQFCTLADPVPGNACTTPTGLTTTGATIGTQTNASFANINTTTNGAPYLWTATPTNINSGVQVTLELDGVVNPSPTVATSSAPLTFYVRISTYTSTTATTGLTDAGNVAASTNLAIILSGQMPESLVFCTGATITTTGGVPDCTTATTGSVSFNQLFSPTDTATATSQMAASTNAGSGYSITVNGPTLTSGSNTITAMASSAAGVRGTSQFGLNLKANTTATSTPAVGVEVAPTSNGTNYRGQAVTGYNTADNFEYNTTSPNNIVANSADGGAGGSDAQIFTVSYIANVVGSQPAGTYTTTITYICTPTF